jgi:hypothetical protein
MYSLLSNVKDNLMIDGYSWNFDLASGKAQLIL